MSFNSCWKELDCSVEFAERVSALWEFQTETFTLKRLHWDAPRRSETLVCWQCEISLWSEKFEFRTHCKLLKIQMSEMIRNSWDFEPFEYRQDFESFGTAKTMVTEWSASNSEVLRLLKRSEFSFGPLWRLLRSSLKTAYQSALARAVFTADYPQDISKLCVPWNVTVVAGSSTEFVLTEVNRRIWPAILKRSPIMQIAETQSEFQSRFSLNTQKYSDIRLVYSISAS